MISLGTDGRSLQSLMSDRESPIIDFYPQDFAQDLNGKKNDWEAVVKIAFIDKDRLKKAMQSAQVVELTLCSADDY